MMSFFLVDAAPGFLSTNVDAILPNEFNDCLDDSGNFLASQFHDFPTSHNPVLHPSQPPLPLSNLRLCHYQQLCYPVFEQRTWRLLSGAHSVAPLPKPLRHPEDSNPMN